MPLYNLLPGDSSKLALTAGYSFVLTKGKDQHLEIGNNLVANFDLDPGSWIVLAKASVRGGGVGQFTVQFTLTVGVSPKKVS